MVHAPMQPTLDRPLNAQANLGFFSCSHMTCAMKELAWRALLATTVPSSCAISAVVFSFEPVICTWTTAAVSDGDCSSFLVATACSAAQESHQSQISSPTAVPAVHLSCELVICTWTTAAVSDVDCRSFLVATACTAECGSDGKELGSLRWCLHDT